MVFSSKTLLATFLYSTAVLSATINVNVGGNKALVFSPTTVNANPGDTVQFTFLDQNHTVTAGNPNAGCQPSGKFNSGFVPVAANANTNPTFSVAITNTQPITVYCAQAQHCQVGMVMVINPSATGATSLNAYTQLCAQAATNTAPKRINGGTLRNANTGATGNTTTGTTDAATAKTGGKGGKGKAKGGAAASAAAAALAKTGGKAGAKGAAGKFLNFLDLVQRSPQTLATVAIPAATPAVAPQVLAPALNGTTGAVTNGTSTTTLKGKGKGNGKGKGHGKGNKTAKKGGKGRGKGKCAKMINGGSVASINAPSVSAIPPPSAATVGAAAIGASSVVAAAAAASSSL